MDISYMLEKAKEVSQAAGDETSSKVSGDDFTKAMQAVKLMKLAGEISGIYKEISKEPEKNTSICEKKDAENDFERDMQTPAIRTIKAAIPYLDFEYQKNIGIMVKIIELDNLIKHYRGTAEAMGNGRKEGWQKEMLLSMKNELQGKNRYYIDMLVRFMDIKDIIAKMNAEEEKNESEA